MLILYAVMNMLQMRILILQRNVIRELFQLMSDITTLGGVLAIFA
jgi:hypothetical protein